MPYGKGTYGSKVGRPKKPTVTEDRSRLQAPKRKATTPNVFHTYADAKKSAPSGWLPVQRTDGNWGFRKQGPKKSTLASNGAASRSRLRFGGR